MGGMFGSTETGKQMEQMMSSMGFKMGGDSKIGNRVARKHLSWYCRYLERAGEFRDFFVRVETVSEQKRLTREFFDRYDEQGRVAKQKRSREGVPDQCQEREPRKLRQENPTDPERTTRIIRYRSGTDHLEASLRKR